MMKENELEVKKRKGRIDDLERKLKVLKKEHKEKKTTADDLMKEANLKLKKALDKNNIAEAKVAQAMLEGAKVVCSEEQAIFKKAELIEKDLSKVKKDLITNMFKKVDN